MRQCPMCKGWIPEGASACQHCGRSLARYNADGTVSSTWTAVMVGLGVAVAIFAVAVYMVAVG